MAGRVDNGHVLHPLYHNTRCPQRFTQSTAPRRVFLVVHGGNQPVKSRAFAFPFFSPLEIAVIDARLSGLIMAMIMRTNTDCTI